MLRWPAAGNVRSPLIWTTGLPCSGPSVLYVGPGSKATYGTGTANMTTRQATTPMPAIRRVSARRDMRARLRAVDPLAVAAGEALMLPDRHGRFQVVDQGVAGVERGGAMPAGHGHHDSKVTDRQITHPVHGGDRVQIESLRDLLGDLA